MQNTLSKLSSFKKIVLLLMLAEFCNLTAVANPGDTTWVTVYNLRKITQYGNYDTTAVFPTGKRYRKIRLHYILGRYACPPARNIVDPGIIPRRFMQDLPVKIL